MLFPRGCVRQNVGFLGCHHGSHDEATPWRSVTATENYTVAMLFNSVSSATTVFFRIDRIIIGERTSHGSKGSVETGTVIANHFQPGAAGTPNPAPVTMPMTNPIPTPNTK